jgi:hypothetical protein
LDGMRVSGRGSRMWHGRLGHVWAMKTSAIAGNMGGDAHATLGGMREPVGIRQDEQDGGWKNGEDDGWMIYPVNPVHPVRNLFRISHFEFRIFQEVIRG